MYNHFYTSKCTFPKWLPYLIFFIYIAIFYVNEDLLRYFVICKLLRMWFRTIFKSLSWIWGCTTHNNKLISIVPIFFYTLFKCTCTTTSSTPFFINFRTIETFLFFYYLIIYTLCKRSLTTLCNIHKYYIKSVLEVPL